MQNSNSPDANPYEVSVSVCSKDNTSEISQEKWYSPTQIYFASIIGGPLAGAILAHFNFAKREQSDNPPCLITGLFYAAFILVSWWPLSLLSSWTSIPFQYLLWAGIVRGDFITFCLGGEMYKEHRKRGGKRSSWLNTIGTGLASCALIFFLAFAINSSAVAAMSPIASLLLAIISDMSIRR